MMKNIKGGSSKVEGLLKGSCKQKAKSSPHIVGELIKLRRRMTSKRQFSSHISPRGWLNGGVGLVLWFFNAKKVKNPAGYWEIYLGSRFAERLCPRQHGEELITACLCNAGIFKVTREAIPKVRPAYYTLTDDWIGIYPSTLNDWQRDRLKIAYQFASDEQYKRRPWLRWIDETLRQTTLPESEELQKAMRNPQTKPSARYAVDFLRGYLPLYERKSSKAKYCGTTYTAIHSCPKELIPTLLIHGEEVAQLDISAAHPSTLPKMFAEAEIKYGVAGGIKEGARLRDDLESDKLYELIAEEFDLTRAEAKEKLLMAFNGEIKYATNDPAYKAFVKIYPIGKQVISMIKQSDKDRLNRKMAQILGKAIDNAIQTCFELAIPCFPRTDEIVCCKGVAKFVREVLAAYFLEETGVNAKVGKERVSFIPTEEDVWEQFSVRYDLAKFTKSKIGRIEDDLPLWNCVKTIRRSKAPNTPLIAA